jgi:hypothetical protein
MTVQSVPGFSALNTVLPRHLNNPHVMRGQVYLMMRHLRLRRSSYLI